MIEFLKYPKMKNSYAIEPDDFGKTTVFYSSEKIDGSNTQMAFLIENNKIKDIKVGSRNRFIEADDKNSKCQMVKDKVYQIVNNK